MALAVIGTMGAGCYVGFNSLNAYAVSSRLYSEAQTAAQNQIDLILSKEPFDVTNNKIPAVLALGTTTTPNVFIYQDPVTGNVVVTGTMVTVVTDPGFTMTFAGTPAKLSATTGNVVVTGTMKTSITDTGATMTFAGATKNLNTYRATVTVTYTYRGKTYNVAMDTMRTGDQ